MRATGLAEEVTVWQSQGRRSREEHRARNMGWGLKAGVRTMMGRVEWQGPGVKIECEF